MSAVSISGVTVLFDGQPALSEVDLDVEAGTTVAIIGPSGSGKSTLLRAIAGLETPTAGRIEIGGRDVAGVPTHKRDLGLMFQDHALFGHLDVAGNVAFGPRMQGWTAERRASRMEEVLQLVGLAGFGQRHVASLSGGEAQRVALARALAPEPALLMLDEPLGSLDRVLREQLTVELRRLLSGLDVTALHVTHDQAEAFAVADRVAVLRHGRIEQVGTPAELWNRPASAFVAEFVGHPNVWSVDGRWELVPVNAIAEDPAGDLDVDVHVVQFREGRYRVAAHRPARGEPIVFETARPVVAGDRVRLRIDRSQVIRLDE